MPRRLVAIPFIAAVIAISACGGDEGLPDASESDEPTADLEGPPEDVEVIRTWAEALTESDTEAAAEFFAIPSQAENGLTYEIETEEDAEFFNESLPCGATLEETSVEGQFITATFELTDRPGVGPCPGRGNLAQTSFVIEDGAIVEWRRVALPIPEDSGQTTS
jgi:hypothetical protein